MPASSAIVMVGSARTLGIRRRLGPDASSSDFHFVPHGTEPRWSALGRTTPLPTREGLGYLGDARLSLDRGTDSTPLEFPGSMPI